MVDLIKINKNWAQKVNTNCLCSGCGLCQSISAGEIVINIDSNGYIRPTLVNSVSPEVEARLDDICPGRHIEHDPSELNNYYHILWGPLLHTREGYATDQEIRFRGSSGGVISALAIYLLQSNKVDYVLHTIASVSNPLLNSLHISRSYTDVLAASGSRYSPSAPLIDFENYLAGPEKFAFIGRPCDVAALKNYARFDKRIREKVCYTISFMCAGIPSIKGTIALLKQFGLAESSIRSVRYRGEGWPGSMVFETMNGERFSMDYEKSWGFLSKFLQFRCKVCPDGVGEFSDISCGDAWFLKEGKPDFSEKNGRSILMTRTERGEQLILDSIQEGYLTAMPMNVGDLLLMQPYQAMRKKLVASRVHALKVLGVQIPNYKNMQLEIAAKHAGIKTYIESFLGTLIRVLLQTSMETPHLCGIRKVISNSLSHSFRKPHKE